MELYNLQMIVRGLDSLADIEKEHPELGAQLLAFVKRVADCCELAYDRLSSALGDVRSLPAKPTSVDIRRVLDKLSDAPSSKWFKDVSGICDRLAVLAEQFGPQLKSQMIYAEGASVNEVAEATGWSESKVKVRAFRARKKAREALEKLLGKKYQA